MPPDQQVLRSNPTGQSWMAATVVGRGEDDTIEIALHDSGERERVPAASVVGRQ